MDELYAFWVKGEIPPLPVFDDVEYNKKRYEVATTISAANWHKNVDKFVYSYGGFLKLKENIMPKDFSFEHFLNVDYIYKYNNFQVKERGNTSASTKKLIDIAITIAKKKYFYISKRLDYSDIDLIYELAEARRFMSKRYAIQHKSNINSKWENLKISHEEARIIVEALKQETAPKTASGNLRSKKILVLAWQRYLMVKCFVYLPVRQIEVRNWVLNKTIFRIDDGIVKPHYKVKIPRKDFRQSQMYESYKLPSILTKDLDIWLFKIQPLINHAVESLENWLDFLDLKIENVKSNMDRAEFFKTIESKNWRSYTNNLPTHIKSKKVFETYRCNLIRTASKNSVHVLALGATRENVTKYLQHERQVFLTLTFNNPEAFAKAISESGVTNLVKTSTGIATKARSDIFAESLQIPPHSFRHIAEHHVRNVNPLNKAKFGKLINHSEKMGDFYASQVANTYKDTFDLADDWWEET